MPLVVTLLMLVAPLIHPYIVGAVVILLSVILYTIHKTHYLAISVAVLALLYGIGFIPVTAFIGPMMMMVWGEFIARILNNHVPDTLAFAAGSVAGIAVTMMYCQQLDWLVGIIAVVVLLMLRSILTNREDASMIGLLGSAMTITLFYDLDFTYDTTMLALAVAVCAGFAYFAYRAKTVDASGVFAAVLFGIILITFAGVPWFLIVISFFILGSFFTKYRYAEKVFLGVEQGKSGRRGYMNAFANALVGVAGAILFGITGNEVFIALFLGCIATATADTLASEIGVTGGTPYMITTLKPVPAGTNGGVTVLGELACLLGAVIICGLAFLLEVAPWYICVIGVIAGFVGTNVDSLIGALIENKGVIGNSGTNLLATLSGGLFAMAAYWVAVTVSASFF
ncbi:hypothetical protein McpSp1_15590 [Methanocorpusculaceae archaeon Sp1]|uniref:TIGR00297 family protein n=2 Tax=Methanorbis furvi TaxID=3028299 RepID=A0AAE4MC83_9EURY|nr:hypothetical protein [Methanocorpusculaceae archaeon Sp1]MDV0441554.1 hypothetical protein [Methanocorpusculaceae archaeon Ag1]